MRRTPGLQPSRDIVHHARMNWYFEREGVSAGPVEESDLILMIRRREVPRDSMIWHPGLDEWQPIAELKPEWLVVPGINSGNGTIAKEEPPPAPKPPAAPARAPASDAPERAESDEGEPPAPPRPSQVRTILPPKGKPQPVPRAAPSASSPPPPEEQPPPVPEKKGFLKKLFGRGKNS